MDRIVSNDEAYSWRIIQYSFQEVLERTGRDANPFLSYVLQKHWAILAGDSIVSLRLFSLLVYACALLVAIACMRQSSQGQIKASRTWNATFLPVILFLHPLLMHQALTARMYAPGLLFAALTSFFMIKSFTVPTGFWSWHILYGVAAAVFAWTHYYAFFALAAQLGFVGALWTWRAIRGDHQWAWSWLLAACWGLGVGMILYAPWIPVFLAQRREVQDGFWIGAPSWPIVRSLAATCFMGIAVSKASAWVVLGWLVVVLVLLYHANRLAWFFLAQATIPWILAIGYSWFSGRSILYDRYFSFATFGWVCCLGICWSRIPTGFMKVIAGYVVAALFVMGCVDEIKSWASPQAHEEAAVFLRDNYRPGDVCWADWAPEVNTLRYYLSQLNLRDVNVRCRLTTNVSAGHAVHMASLSADDLFTGDFPEGKRIWRCSPVKSLVMPIPPGMAETMRRTFEAPGGVFYSVVLLEASRQ